MLSAMILFAATYILMISFGKFRPYIALASGAALGGNCTPIGASANIAGIGILRKEGYEVKNSDFFKIGIPFTLSAIVPAYILIWILFG
jgi:Na+/H+ antiporter NhaD/arsenite permease-like protein